MLKPGLTVVAGKLIGKYRPACCILIDDFFLLLFFDPEYGGDAVLRKNRGHPRN
jgi:hypothetical protein